MTLVSISVSNTVSVASYFHLSPISLHQLLLHQFVTSLPIAVSKQLRASDDAKLLDKAAECAWLLMAIENDQTQTAAAVEAREVQELRKQISELMEQVAVLTMSKMRQRT